jgi:hypothetical protein
MRKGKKQNRTLRTQRLRRRRAFLRKHPGERAAEMRRWTVSVEHWPIYVQGRE